MFEGVCVCGFGYANVHVRVRVHVRVHVHACMCVCVYVCISSTHLLVHAGPFACQFSWLGCQLHGLHVCIKQAAERALKVGWGEAK